VDSLTFIFCILYLILTIILIILLLYIFRFYMRITHSVEFEDKKDSFISLFIATSIPLIIICSIPNYINKFLDYCCKYTIIPLFVFSQIWICLFLIFLLCFSQFLFNLLISSVKTEPFIELISKAIMVLYKPIHEKRLGMLYLDPFYRIHRNNRSKSNIYNIKSTVFACYLLSGLIIISPFYNYIISLKDAKNLLRIIDHDYEIYKNIFIISLIPYFLNFTLNNKHKYLANNPDNPIE
jgi:hypothetical protein